MIWPSPGTILFDLLSDGQSLKWIKIKLSSITNAIWSFQGCIMVQVVAGKAVTCLFCGCTIPESPFFGIFCQVRTHQGVFGEFLVSRYLALFQTFGLLLFPSILGAEKHPILANIFEFFVWWFHPTLAFEHHFCQMHFSGLNLQPESSSESWPASKMHKSRSSSRWAEKQPAKCWTPAVRFRHTPIRDEENILCESLPDRCGWTGITIYP